MNFFLLVFYEKSKQTQTYFFKLRATTPNKKVPDPLVTGVMEERAVENKNHGVSQGEQRLGDPPRKSCSCYFYFYL